MVNRTEMNKKARRMIAEVAEEHGLDRCELCGSTFGVAPAHRFPRIHYRTAEELSDYNSWICLCIKCHTRLDDRSQTTEEEKENIFKRFKKI